MDEDSEDDAEAADAFWRVALMDQPAARCAADDAVPDLEDELVERAMANMDEDQDGLISIHDFQAWSKRNTVLGMVETFVDEKVEAGFALAAS